MSMPGLENKIFRRRMIGAYASSVISISLVLFLFGMAALLVVNARSVSDYFKESLQMTLMLKQGVGDAEAEQYRASLDSLPFIHSTRLVTVEEGEQELKAMLGEDFLSVFETSPIPVSIDLTLNSEYVSPDSVEVISAVIRQSPLVDELECRQSLVDALSSNLARMSVFLGIFILLLFFISTVLISNTVRLSAYANRFLIYTRKLVGATRSFIVRPFVLEAVRQGLVAALIADAEICALLFVARKSFLQLFEIFRTRLIVLVLVAVAVVGVLICVLSTLVIVNKTVSLNKDELYG